MKSNHLFKHFDFFLLDEIVLTVSFLLSCLIRKTTGLFYYDKVYIYVVIAIAVLQFLIAFFGDGYKDIMSRGYYIEFLETIKNVSVIIAFIILYMFLSQTSSIFSRMALTLFWLISIVLMYVTRLLLKKKIKSRNLKSKKKLILVGKEEDLEKAILSIKENKDSIYEIKGLIVTRKIEEEEINDILVINDLKEYARLNPIDDVLFFEKDKEIYDSCVLMGLTVHNVVLNSKVSPSKIYVDEFEGYGVITRRVYDDASNKFFIKRIFDILISIIGMILLIVITIVIGPVIYFSDPGPIFFKQIRVGKNGKRFKLYKFRSMYQNAEDIKNNLLEENEMQGLMFKMENDPRIIKGIGSFIRKTSLDEFPQFINVFKGDMSIVGTRPPTEDEFERYEYHHMRRLSIKPGITGLWQISGRNEITDFEKVVELDNKYIDEWSLAFDLKIIFKTMFVIITGKGAK